MALISIVLNYLSISSYQYLKLINSLFHILYTAINSFSIIAADSQALFLRRTHSSLKPLDIAIL